MCILATVELYDVQSFKCGLRPSDKSYCIRNGIYFLTKQLGSNYFFSYVRLVWTFYRTHFNTSIVPTVHSESFEKKVLEKKM